MVVPAQCGYPVAFFQTQILQALRQAASAIVELAIGVFDQGFIWKPGNDLVGWKQGACTFQKVIQG
jgi:hypothetical protein